MPLNMGTQLNDKPRDYLVWSILSTIFCCLPLGIAGIVFSVKTRDANNLGDFNTAIKNHKRTFLFNVLALVTGVIIFLIYLTLSLVASQYKNTIN